MEDMYPTALYGSDDDQCPEPLQFGEELIQDNEQPLDITESEDQAYTPLFPEATLDRAAGPTISLHNSRDTSFWGSEPASLFGEADTEFPDPLDFHLLDLGSKKIVERDLPPLSTTLEKDFPTGLPTGIGASTTVLQSSCPKPIAGQPSSLSRGIVFHSSDIDSGNVFALLLSIFQMLTDCWIKPKEQIGGFYYHMHERCEFMSSLKSVGEAWILSIDHISGSRTPLQELLTRLSSMLDSVETFSDVTVRSRHPPSVFSMFSAGPAARHCVSSEAAAPGDDQGLLHLFAKAQSRFLEDQREGLRALALLVPEKVQSKDYSAMVNVLLSTMRCGDDELSWMTSYILTVMTHQAGFSEHVVPVLGQLFELLESEVSIANRRTTLNIAGAIEQTLKSNSAKLAFLKHTKILGHMKHSPESRIRDLEAVVSEMLTA